MNALLLKHFNQELRHFKEVGAEFARAFPKVARRLGMEGIEVQDPLVERLLEGAAFLAARIQVRLDAEFPEFSHHLLEMLYPHYLAPTPAILVAQFQPILTDANLAAGSPVERGTKIRNVSARLDATPCEFLTAQAVTLWPIEVVGASYFSYAPDLPVARLNLSGPCKGGVRIRLRCTAGLSFRQTAVDALRFFLGGADEVAYKLHELIGSASLLGALCVFKEQPALPVHHFIPAERVRLIGFDDDEALLPVPARNFAGYRLLQEYFSFPQRYLFWQIDGLAAAAQRNADSEMELVLLFGRNEPSLEKVVDGSNFLLYCTPAINLFEKTIDQVQLDEARHEFHVVVDRTQPLDFEIYDLLEVEGCGAGVASKQTFFPFYADYHACEIDAPGFFSLRRAPRLPSPRQQRGSVRGDTGYVGSEVFLSLVDPQEAPYRGELRQLSLRARCTNRDLPFFMLFGGTARSDFSLEIAAKVDAIRCVKGPSRPYPALAEGAQAWMFISLLSLNYLSLLDVDQEEGAAALREILSLHLKTTDQGMRKQVEGLRSVRCQAVVTRLPMPGPLCFGRGIRVSLDVDELHFEGGSAFLLGSVLERFLARHVTINSFTETVLRSSARGEIMHWPARCGLRPIV